MGENKSAGLNDQQQKTVNHQDGPLLVVAGAGTGKTHVIVERIVRLIGSGVPKQEILALTFTEKAAQEVLDRVSERLEESYGVEIAIHTFNAFGQMLLREYAIEIGLSSNLKLVGDDGKIVFLRERIDALGLDYFAPISRPEGQLGVIANYFSELKQQLIAPEKYIEFANRMPKGDEAERLERLKQIELANAFEHYIKATRALNIIDYDDQIYLLVELLEKRPNVLKVLRSRYKYIMVDEFQDTNPMQSRLIDLLASEHQNVMVVGDDDQAIYGWRGATLANILGFTKRYSKAEEITLIENYRSTQEVLDSAWKLIQQNNPDRLEHMNKLDKRLQSNRGQGSQPTIHCFSTLEGELAWVANDIASRIENKQDPGSIAILGRSKRSVTRIHEVLGALDIEHTVAGLGEDLYKQPIVLMMVDALKAVWDPKDSTALYHTLASELFNFPASALSEASHQARAERKMLIDILNETDNIEIQQILSLLSQWHDTIHNLSVRAMSYQILTDSGLKNSLYESAVLQDEAARKVYSLGQWFSSLDDFENISVTPSVFSYLENFPALRAEGELLTDDTLAFSPDLPSVMTIHKSKGLEWQTVYIIDCSEYSFPFLSGGKSLKVPEDLKLVSDADARLPEERRLMYVAVTRARDELVITYAQKHSGNAVRKPSRFIEEMGLIVGESKDMNGKTNLEGYIRSSANKPVSLPASMREGDNIVLSASQAEDYITCPLNFYYRHILGVPEKPGPQAAVGSLFHGLIESINRSKYDGLKAPKKSDLIAQLVANWPKVGYASLPQKERALEQGVKSFDALYDRLISEPVPTAVEAPFRVHIPDSKCILKGRIDVVMPAGDSVEIHDYKTSTSVTTAETAKRRTTESKQLTMYAAAWRIMTGEAPSLVSLDFVQTGHIGVVKKMARSIDNIEKKLAEIAELIDKDQYPEGSQHDHCIHPL